MKIIVIFLSILFFVKCDNPVEPIGENIEFLWKIYESNPNFLDREIFSGSGSITSDESHFYFHNSVSDDDSRVYKISFKGKIVKVSDVIGRYAGTTSIFTVDDKLYTSVQRKGVFCLDKNTLEVIWQVPSNSLNGDIILSDSSKIYQIYGRLVKALDLRTGVDIWETRLEGGAIGQCATDNDRLYVSTMNVLQADGYLHYINKQTGEVEQKIVLPFIEEYNSLWGGAFSAGTTINSTSVFVGCSNRYIYCFDKDTGKKEWEFLSDAPVSAPLIISDNILYTGTLNGSIYAFEVDTGKLKWKYYSGYSFNQFPKIYRDYVIFSNAMLYVFNKFNGSISEHLEWTESNPYYYYSFNVNSSGQIILAAFQDLIGEKNDKSLFMSFQLN